MSTTVNKILTQFSQLENDEIVIRSIVLNTVIPALYNLNDEQKYSSYLTVINFPDKSIKNGSLLLSKMIELDIVPKEYLALEKNVYYDTLPSWVKKIIN